LQLWFLRIVVCASLLAGDILARKEEKMKKIASLLIILLIGVAMDADAKKKARKFYLTQDFFTGSQALTACANKFHMASLWEIFEVSTLRYDIENGFVSDDSGSGPPGTRAGWVRTGFSSLNISTDPGKTNCSLWTTDTGFGTIIVLDSTWDNLGLDFSISPWRAGVAFCSNPLPVWCVQD
jgi:hypothetical protein